MIASLFLIAVIAACCVIVANAQYANPLTFSGAFDLTYGLFSSTVGWMASQAGMAETCSMVDEITQTLSNALPKQIKAQGEAIRLILNAVSAWEFQKRSGVSDPLVLAFTGSTGVGKTETAHRLADSVLTKHVRVGNSRRSLPQGLLVLRGEDYSLTSEYATLGLGEVHKHIKKRLFDHLLACSPGGNTIVIFDEIQKVIPGALDALLSSLGERGFVTSGSDSKSTAVLSTANCIFIFISDIGSERMVKLLLAYDEKKKIPKNAMRLEVKAALDEQWERLQFGKMIKEVIPFLPLERADITDILRLKIEQMSVDYQFIYWMDLAVDESALEELTGEQYITYANHTTTIRPKAQVAAVEATAGGDSGAAEVKAALPVVKSKLFATWGARALMNAGPVQDLQALFFRYMQPWRPRQVLHVGLRDSKRGASGGSEAQLFLQWCTADPAIYSGSSRPVVTPKMAFSDQCETMWFGPLRKL